MFDKVKVQEIKINLDKILDKRYSAFENIKSWFKLKWRIGKNQSSNNFYRFCGMLFDNQNVNENVDLTVEKWPFFSKDSDDKTFYFVYPISEKFEKTLFNLLTRINFNNTENNVLTIFLPVVLPPLVRAICSPHIVLIKLKIDLTYSEADAEYIDSRTFLYGSWVSKKEYKSAIQKCSSEILMFRKNVEFKTTYTGHQIFPNISDCGRFVMAYMYALFNSNLNLPKYLCSAEIYEMISELRAANF